MPKITTEWQRFEELPADVLYEVLRFRQSIFVVEQRSPYPDLDGFGWRGICWRGWRARSRAIFA